MMTSTRWARRHDDDGVALVSVIGVTFALMILVAAMATYAVGNQRSARGTQDWNAALAAAYAGVEEYQSRLAANDAYWQYGNPLHEFSTDSGSTVALPPDDAANPAFSLADWADVAGSDGAAEFRYEIDNSSYYTDGTLRVRSTGRAGGETRSVIADLRQKGFIEFLYFTDYEILDPLISGSTADCNRYRYNGRPTADAPSGCGTINFISADTFNGPVHSNDGIQVCGTPRFLGQTTSSFPNDGSQRYYVGGSCANGPVFSGNPGGRIGYQGILGMPDTNSELKKETRPDLPDTVPNPGCLYTGPTSIVLSADGKMRVKSPWTRWTSPVSGENNDGCGTPGTSGLGAADGELLDVKNNNVVYVQNVPTEPADANYWATGAAGAPVCLPEDRTSASGRNAAGNPVGYPIAGEYVANADVYGCRNGDGFVHGTLDGRMTIASENYLYVTGDVRYEDSDDDMLGLVGQNAVFVHNPQGQSSTANTTSTLVETQINRTRSQRDALLGSNNGWQCVRTQGSSDSASNARFKCDRYVSTTTYTFAGTNSNLNTDSGRRIDAAILSVAHTFMVQHYNRFGNRGTLNVNGAIAQKYRGAVGTGSGGTVSTGYAKNYQYDQRFRYTGPPKFLAPSTITYGITVWVEVKPVFDGAGDYR
jgi:hypothetical protein